MTTRQEAIRRAALVLLEARAERDALGPRAAAKAAWYPGHRLTVDEIEQIIIRQRSEAEEAWAAGTHPYQLRQQQLPHAA